MIVPRKKLIEVALPLDAINRAAAKEKSIRHGHPSTLHLWWARRPLAAARAVIFSQLVDDPASVPEEFPTEADQQRERQRLFELIERLVLWENTTNEDVLGLAREEIRRSWRRACADNADYPGAAELFDPDRLPAFHDPFAGGGALPLEAQRLGLEAHASDLNPVAVLINKAMVEIPPRFAGKGPVNREDRAGLAAGGDWPGASGLAADVRHYGKWIRDEARKRIGHLYPNVEVTAEMAAERADLAPYVGRELTVIAWLWARTVRSPNPAFADVDVPLVSTFMLSTKKSREVYVEPEIEGRGYRFDVKVGVPPDAASAKAGTKLSRGANFRCLMSNVAMSGDYIKGEGKAGRMGVRLMAVVAQGKSERVYVAPTISQERIALAAEPTWEPQQKIAPDRRSMFTPLYGMTHFRDLHTARQLVALGTFADLVSEVRSCVQEDAVAVGVADDGRGLDDGGRRATAYADAVSVYLAFALSKQADLGNSLCRWEPRAQCPRQLFGRQAIPMMWDFAEGNPLGDSSGGWTVLVNGICRAFSKAFQSIDSHTLGWSQQADAGSQCISRGAVVSTDPPYYDNIGYADLSDFFYAWLRRSLRPTYPNLFATVSVPKADELVAAPYRHGGKKNAEEFFISRMTLAMGSLARQAHSSFPVSIYYAFKQSERRGDAVTSTGWETFLNAVIQAGFSVTGTWPMRTENSSRMIGQRTNALASSVVLVCRKARHDATLATRREFITALRSELPRALVYLQSGNIAPVDLAQAAIGPGMAVYTRYARSWHVQRHRCSFASVRSYRVRTPRMHLGSAYSVPPRSGHSRCAATRDRRIGDRRRNLRPTRCVVGLRRSRELAGTGRRHRVGTVPDERLTGQRQRRVAASWGACPKSTRSALVFCG